MIIKKANNVLSEEEIQYFKNIVDNLEIPLNDDGSYVYDENTGYAISEHLGRLQFTINKIDNKIRKRLIDFSKDLLDFDSTLSSVTYVEYSSKYGIPVLPPHFDGDSSELIINYQLSSNTQWDIGLDLKTYTLEDNSALIFNPNKTIHWRTHKEFKDNEFVKMIFFRFSSRNNPKDNSELRYSLNHEAYKEANIVRDSLQS